MRINIGTIEVETKEERLGWSDAGGCEAATARMAGDWRTAETLLGLLGEGVEIYPGSSSSLSLEGKGGAAWWGYLNGVEIHLYGCRIVWTLDEVSNRVQTEYIQLDGALAGGGDAQVTGWADDLVSQGRYGVKERRLFEGWSTLTLACGARDRELSRRRLPCAKLTPEGGERVGGITVHMKGWWQRLGWRYFYQAAGRVVFDDLGLGKQDFGNASGKQKLAQSFTVGAGGWRCEQAAVYIRKVGNPLDVLLWRLYSDSAGAPGTLLATATMAGSTLSTDYRWESGFLAPAGNLMANGGVYWLVVERSGTMDAGNYYRVRCNENLGYTGGVMRLWNGSSWVARSPNADLNFRVWGLAEVASQVAGVVNYAGGLGVVEIMSTTGEYTNPYRDGSLTCLDNANNLLRMAGLRAEVLASKRVLITRRPVGEAGLKLSEKGQPSTLEGRVLWPGEAVAGELIGVPEWAWGMAGEKGVAYVKRVEWSAERGWVIEEVDGI